MSFYLQLSCYIKIRVGRLYEHVNYLYALLDRGAGLRLGRKMRAIQLEIKK